MPMIAPTNAIKVVHTNRLASYGRGVFEVVADAPGQCWARFEGTDQFRAGVRRVLVRDLAPERDGGRLVEDQQVAS